MGNFIFVVFLLFTAIIAVSSISFIGDKFNNCRSKCAPHAVSYVRGDKCGCDLLKLEK